jgi:asparagine synthase (glutamine-hydrolysing)
MANFVICVDEDTDRRRRFVEAVQNRLPPFRGLVMGNINSREFDATWAADPRAPLAHVSDEEGTAILFGEMITYDGSRLNPAALRDRWSEPIVERIHADLDGYYAGCVYLPGRRLLVGADLLGLFPIYYYGIDDVVLVGSSPETFASHPCFRSTFNPTGLVGLLLTNGLFDGETLLAGVRRLAPGHLLVWEHGAPLRVVPYYRTPFSDRYLDLSFSSHLDILDEAMGAAIKRHVAPGRTYSLLLSGGLDSRTIGGYLEEAGREVIALTLGTPTDIEVRCATLVARSLGMRQHVRELDAGRYPDLARLHTTWEHCAAGSSLIMQWGMREILRDLPSPYVTGLGLDWVLGGHAPTEPGLSFDSFFRYQNVWGFAPDHLKALLRKEVFSDTVSTTMKRIQETYTSYSKVESRRAWSFSLHHRQRFHIGSEAWRLTFAGWPTVLAADKALLEIGASLPPATAADRRAQVELLRTRFPELAELPLDRNSVDTTPLLPGLRWLLGRRLRRPLQRFQSKLSPRRGHPSERRRYYRIFNINSPGWAALRREVEPSRKLAHSFFERKVLDELLPPPDTPIRSRDGITDVAGIKTIIGFLLWARDHL